MKEEVKIDQKMNLVSNNDDMKEENLSFSLALHRALLFHAIAVNRTKFNSEILHNIVLMQEKKIINNSLPCAHSRTNIKPFSIIFSFLCYVDSLKSSFFLVSQEFNYMKGKKVYDTLPISLKKTNTCNKFL